MRSQTVVRAHAVTILHVPVSLACRVPILALKSRLPLR